MNWLIHNPLADMPGPAFLVLYLVVVVVALIVCSQAVLNLDQTRDDRPLLVPSNPDPYEIAYLRGGGNETTRLAVFSLLQRGYLQMVSQRRLSLAKTLPKDRIAQVMPPPSDPARLPPLERAVFDYFVVPRTAADVFDSALPRRVKEHCTLYESKLRDERLLISDEQKARAGRIAWLGAWVVLGLGGYKVLTALVHGRTNVWFTIFIACGAIAFQVALCQMPRLSRRGHRYLGSLQRAFDRLRKPAAVEAASGAALDPLLLAFGVFGVAALVGTPHAAYAQMFQRASAGGGSGGCGSGGGGSCGGGGCGGGGCGGGCGGG